MPIATFSDLKNSDEDTNALLKESTGNLDIATLDSEYYKNNQNNSIYTLIEYKNGFLSENKIFYNKNNPKTANMYVDIAKGVVPRELEPEIRQKLGNNASEVVINLEKRTTENYKEKVSQSFNMNAPEYNHKAVFLSLTPTNHTIHTHTPTNNDGGNADDVKDGKGDIITVKFNDLQKREKTEIKLMKNWSVVNMYEKLKFIYGDRIKDGSIIELKCGIPPKMIKIEIRNVGDLKLFNNTINVYFKKNN